VEINQKNQLNHRLSIQQIWLLVPPILAFILLNLAPLREGDLWWHLKIGEEIYFTHRIPLSDHFSFTAFGSGYYFARSWLSDLAFYGIYRIGGLSALVSFQALTASAIIVILIQQSLHRFASPRVTSVLAMISLLGLYSFSTARPQIFSFLCFALFTKILADTWYGRKRRLWVLPVIMLAWVNCHAAWVIGLFLIGLVVLFALLRSVSLNRGLGEMRPLFIWGGLTLLVVLVNPEGINIINDPLAASSNLNIQQYISEWQPVSVTQMYALPFFILLVILIFALAYSRTMPDLYSFVLMLAFLLLSMRYVRALPFYYILVTPFIAGWLSGLDLGISVFSKRDPESHDRILRSGSPRLNTAILAGLILFSILSIPQVRLPLTGKTEIDLVDDYFPFGAAQFLENLEGEEIRLFNMPEWGGYLNWRLNPKMRVFVDGRVELYPSRVWQDYIRIARVDGDWAELLNQYQVDYLVLSMYRHTGLISAAHQAGLPRLFEDEKSILFMMEKNSHTTSE